MTIVSGAKFWEGTTKDQLILRDLNAIADGGEVVTE